MNKNWLAEIFDWMREVIEAAETPFAKFAIFVLPILAPVVPASVTGVRLTTELNFHPALSFITALVLEMLGYVGAISSIRAIYKWFKKEGSFLSVVLNGLAYAFYVVAMYQINVRLGSLAGDNPIVNQVFALLSFITIPTGLLAAEHINERTEYYEQKELRNERRAERIEKYKIRTNAANERSSARTNERSVRRRTNERTNTDELRTVIYQLLDEYYQANGQVAGVSDLARTVARSKNQDGSEVGFERYKGYISEVRKNWMETKQ